MHALCTTTIPPFLRATRVRAEERWEFHGSTAHCEARVGSISPHVLRDASWRNVGKLGLPVTLVHGDNLLWIEPCKAAYLQWMYRCVPAQELCEWASAEHRVRLSGACQCPKNWDTAKATVHDMEGARRPPVEYTSTLRSKCSGDVHMTCSNGGAQQ